jgi:hypothetical protein
VTGGHDPCRPIHGRPEKVTVSTLGLSGVDAHANPQRSGYAPSLTTQSPLGIEGGRKRAARGVESGNHPVAGRLEESALGPIDGSSHDRIVSRKGGCHGDGLLFPVTRARLDVGEQKRLHQRGI